MTIWDKRSSQMTIWWQPWSLCHRHHLCQRLGTIVLQTGLPSCPAMFSRTTFHNNIFWLISNWCRFHQTGPKANHLALGNSGCKHLFHLLLWHPTIRAVVHETLRMKYLDINVGICDNPIFCTSWVLDLMKFCDIFEGEWGLVCKRLQFLLTEAPIWRWPCLAIFLEPLSHIVLLVEIQVLQISIVRLSWILNHVCRVYIVDLN